MINAVYIPDLVPSTKMSCLQDTPPFVNLIISADEELALDWQIN